VGRGAAYGDWDNDGDLDLLLTANGGWGRLLRNDTPAENGWLRLVLTGTASNRDAIGARVAVRVGERTLVRCVKSGSSYLSESDRRLTFGLGRAPRADTIEIQWPSGAVQTLGPVARNQELRVKENS
jgi:enediyne biosynthesis protein E4